MSLDAIFFKKELIGLPYDVSWTVPEEVSSNSVSPTADRPGKHNKYRYTGLTMEHLGLDLVITSQVGIALMNSIQSALGTLTQRTLSDQVTLVAQILTGSCVLVL